MFGIKDKRIVYALLGGAALAVGTAAYFHLNSQPVVDMLDDDLQELGPMKRDASGYIDFEYFIKLFEISSFHAKNAFAERKQEFVNQRRQDKTDMLMYKKIVVKMMQEEEIVISEKLNEIIAKAGIEQLEFQKNVQYHGQDNYKKQQIIRVQKNIALTGEGEILDKQKVLKAFVTLQEIQFQQMEKMQKDMADKDPNAMSDQSQMEMVLNGMTEHALGQDRLFEETGVEEEQLLYSIQQLKLEQDPEFIDIQSKANAKAMQLAQQAEGGKAGAGPMSMF